MAYGPADYYRLGRVHARTALREPWTRLRRVPVVVLFPPSGGPVSKSDSETGSGAEGVPNIAQSSAETGGGVEGVANISQTLAETGQGVEGWSITVTFTQAETGLGVEGTPNVGQVLPELGSGVEGLAAIGQSQSEVGAGNDLQSISASLLSSDTAVGVEGQSLSTGGNQVLLYGGTWAAPLLYGGEWTAPLLYGSDWKVPLLYGLTWTED